MMMIGVVMSWIVGCGSMEMTLSLIQRAFWWPAGDSFCVVDTETSRLSRSSSVADCWSVSCVWWIGAACEGLASDGRMLVDSSGLEGCTYWTVDGMVDSCGNVSSLYSHPSVVFVGGAGIWGGCVGVCSGISGGISRVNISVTVECDMGVSMSSGAKQAKEFPWSGSGGLRWVRGAAAVLRGRFCSGEDVAGEFVLMGVDCPRRLVWVLSVRSLFLVSVFFISWNCSLVCSLFSSMVRNIFSIMMVIEPMDFCPSARLCSLCSWAMTEFFDMVVM